MLKGFAYHGVNVSDLERSVAFYRDLLHMKVEETYEAAGDALAQATGLPGARQKVAMLGYTDTSGYHRLKLVQWLAPEGKQRFEARLNDLGASHADYCVEQVKQEYEALLAQGARFISPPVVPFPERPERSFTYLLDPDGIVSELHRRNPHHAHAVSDLDTAVAFYRDVLEMKLDCILEIRGKGIEQGTGFSGVYLHSGHMVIDTEEYVELHHYVTPAGKRSSGMKLCDVGRTHVAFDVDDVQKSYQDLQAKGVNFISRPVHLPAEAPGATMVYLIDPHEYLVELRSGPTS
ncbi:MAG: VOC family protein [Chloroflexi bacterium]|nr:VOC family protein [Chloroflexota bacterium]